MEPNYSTNVSKDYFTVSTFIIMLEGNPKAYNATQITSKFKLTNKQTNLMKQIKNKLVMSLN